MKGAAGGIGGKIARAWREAGARGVARGVRRWTRVRKLDTLDPDEEYRLWLSRFPSATGRDEVTADGGSARALALVFTRGASAADLTTTEGSLRRESNRCMVRPLESAETLPDSGGANFVLGAAAADLFLPGALAALAAGIAEAGERGLVYADEDLRGPAGARHRPFLKPAWSPLLSLTYPGRYPGAPAAVAGRLWDEIVAETKGRIGWTEAILLATDRAARILHVPRPLLSRRSRGGNDPLLGEFAARRAAAESARERRGLPGRLVPGEAPESLRLEGAADRPLPPISILVPTRDHPEFLLPLGEALERERDGPDVELVFLDHDTRDQRARHYLDTVAARGTARVLPCSGPFNFARMINRGVDAARGELLLLLNNDVLPRREGWLEALAHATLLPGVAAAGALLVYADGTIQHAGIGLGLGIIGGHLHKGSSLDRSPFCVDPRVAREVAAVTAACMMIRREDFTAAGGLDERELAVSFNDVDLCLRLGARGRRILYEPAAVLVHHETRSRDVEVDPGETRVMRERWGPVLATDAYLPPGLTRLCERPHLELWSRFSSRPRAAPGC